VVSFDSADALAVNGAGQTAKDIAEFWLHDVIAAKLSTQPQSLLSTAAATRCSQQRSNYFCGSPLDRASELRMNTDWLSEAQAASSTVFILFVRLDLVGRKTNTLIRPRRFRYSEIKPLLQSHRPTVIFLGVERESASGMPSTNRSLTPAWFAVNMDISDKELHELAPDAELMSVHPRMLTLTRCEASIVGHARSILAWHDRYCFCPTCGSATEMRDAGYKRVCVKQDCRSKTGLQCLIYLRHTYTVRLFSAVYQTLIAFNKKYCTCLSILMLYLLIAVRSLAYIMLKADKTVFVFVY